MIGLNGGLVGHLKALMLSGNQGLLYSGPSDGGLLWNKWVLASTL